LTKFSGSSKQIREKTKKYVRENWGFPVIAGFILLLLVAAILLVFSNYFASMAAATDQTRAFSSYFLSGAEVFANCAYFALAVGAVLLLGKVNSTSVHEGIVKIKKLKVITKCIRFGKNRLNKGVEFYGSD
jgi:uncharacterized membrane protein